MVFGFVGKPILVEFRPNLRAHRGKLVCGDDRGTEVHAGSFLRERRIVLDSALLRDAAERDRILAHEIAHFVWWRAGRPRRIGYELMIQAELEKRLPGEMGWSAESRKIGLTRDQRLRRTGGYRDYLCESFCDTLASEMLGLAAHEEITLPKNARRIRSRWLHSLLPMRDLRI